MLRRFIPLVLTICVLLSMTPPPALAAEAGRETSRRKPVVVTEDTTVTGPVDTLVLIDAPVQVEISGARLSVGLFVSPAAKGAVVTVKGESRVREIVVAAAATVKVGKSAAVEAITVDAPAAVVEVAGSVETITVSEAAQEAGIVIAEEAAVDALEIAAPGVRAEVAGTVEKVAIAGTADDAELIVTETAAISAITDNTDGASAVGTTAEAVVPNDPDIFPVAGDGAAQPPVEESAGETVGGDTEEEPAPPAVEKPRITWGSSEFAAENTNPYSVTAGTDDMTVGEESSYWVKFAVAAPENTEEYTYTLAVKEGSGGMIEGGFIWIDIEDIVNEGIYAEISAFLGDEANFAYDEDAGEWNISTDDGTATAEVEVQGSVGSVLVTVTATPISAPEDDSTGIDGEEIAYDYTFDVQVDGVVTVDITESIILMLAEKSPPEELTDSF